MLHVTNGDSVTGTMREAALPGQYLAWNDVLHDGAVPSGFSLAELTDVRARVLSDFQLGEYPDIREGLANRDKALTDFRKHDEVVLWFEHDLYDQLQLIQLLDYFSRQDLGRTKLSIIQINSHPDIKPFFGLGELNAKQIAALFPTRKPVSPEQLRVGREAWSAFTGSEPSALEVLSHRPLAAMPFLAAAFERFLQEYPWAADGLSRTERQILRAVAAGHHEKLNIYSAASVEEEVPWGDLSVFLRMDWLAKGEHPALQLEDRGFRLTEDGKRLLAGEADWIALSGGIDRWLGGVHLQGKDAEWRWDDVAKKLRHS